VIKNAKIVSKGRTPDSYHEQTAKRGTPEFIMSSSSLRAFAECPQKWFNGFEFADSKATKWGRLLDVCLLTPDEFPNLYAVRPPTYKDAKTGEEKPWNANSNVCKAWIEEQGEREIVGDGELEKVRQAIARIRSDEIIAAWCAACDTQVLVEAEWHDKPTGLVIPVRCLIDFVPRNDTEFAKCVGDLKTTCNAKPQAWQRWCYTAGYHIQGAFNLDMIAAATGEDRNTFCFILSESFEPWQTGKRMLSEDFKELGRAEYTKHLRNYAQCVKSGRWPGYDDTDEAIQSWSIVSPEPWMNSAAMFAPNYSFGDEPEGETEEDGRFDISN
jgi:exodeoxyribonuclease VIII